MIQEITMTRLSESVQSGLRILAGGDLADDEIVGELLAETHGRRRLDLSDLTPMEQAELISRRTVDVLPSLEVLRDTIAAAGTAGLLIKFGIDPTGPEIHLGHAVPMILLNRV